MKNNQYTATPNWFDKVQQTDDSVSTGNTYVTNFGSILLLSGLTDLVIEITGEEDGNGLSPEVSWNKEESKLSFVKTKFLKEGDPITNADYVTTIKDNPQEVLSNKDFIDGLSINKHRFFEKDGILYLDGNLALTGGLVVYADNPEDGGGPGPEFGGGGTILDIEVKGEGNALADVTLSEDKTILTFTKFNAVDVTSNLDITGIKNFLNGIKLNGHKLYEKDGVIYLEGDLAVTGGITTFATAGREVSTIMDGIACDETTIRVNPDTGKLEVIGGTGEGGTFDPSLLWELLEASTTEQINKSHLTTALNGYMLTSNFTASNILTKLKTVDGSSSGLDADLLDGTHKSGLFTSLSSSKSTNLSITVGGTTKTISSLIVDYARNLANAVNLWGLTFDGSNDVSGEISNCPRIHNNGSSLYLGNSDNSSYVYVLDMVSLNGTSYWILKQNGEFKAKCFAGTNLRIECDNNGNASTYASEINNFVSNVYIQHHATGDVILCNGGGKVGIGTTAPSTKLYVNGTARISDKLTIAGAGIDMSYGNNWKFIRVNRAGIEGDYIQFFVPGYNAQDAYFEMRSNGTFYVNYNILASGGITQYSDQRAKTIIEQINLSLQSIANSPVVRFKWNNWKQKDDGKTHIGGIAQYVQTILPEVIYNSDDVLTMDYATTGYVFAVNTAKHLLDYETKTDKEINKLKKRIKYLEKQLKKLGYEEANIMDN